MDRGDSPFRGIRLDSPASSIQLQFGMLAEEFGFPWPWICWVQIDLLRHCCSRRGAAAVQGVLGRC